jgi:hypothetical protein
MELTASIRYAIKVQIGGWHGRDGARDDPAAAMRAELLQIFRLGAPAQGVVSNDR